MAPFSTNKLNTIKDHTCWIRVEDTSILKQEYYVLTMEDTMKFTKEMNTFMKITSQAIRDSIKSKYPPPPVRNMNFSIRQYRIMVNKSSHALYNIYHRMNSDNELIFVENSRVQVILDQLGQDFQSKLKSQRGK